MRTASRGGQRVPAVGVGTHPCSGVILEGVSISLALSVFALHPMSASAVS